MSKTYYRFHWADCPAFGADNAWSALWGTRRSADGTQTECLQCGGTGTHSHTETCPDCRGWRDDYCDRCDDAGYVEVDECDQCDGTGWEDCQRGYSACHTAEDLIAYLAKRGEVADSDGQVIIFEGVQVGTGFDGEPLVIPTTIITTMSWTELVRA